MREGATPPWKPPPLDGLIPVPTYLDTPVTPAVDLGGVDLAGRPVHVDVLGTGHWTLLVFLSAGCEGCVPIWEALADPQGSGLSTDEVLVAVSRDPAVEDLMALRRLAPQGATVVMSSEAWAAYRVQGPPFFALVDGKAGAKTTVATEGVAWSVGQIAADVARAASAAERRFIVYSALFDVETRSNRVTDLTGLVSRFCASRGDGLCSVFAPHATAGLALMELGSSSEADLSDLLDRLVPRDDRYLHRHGTLGHGADHLVPVLISPSLTVPVVDGRLLLGTWQSVVLVDTNPDNPRRQVRCSWIGSAG